MKLIQELITLEAPGWDFGNRIGSPQKDVQAATESVTNEYEDSADFTNDLQKAKELLDQFDAIISTPKFRNWIEITDKKYGTDCDEKLNDVFGDHQLLHKSWDDLSEEIDKAQ